MPRAVSKAPKPNTSNMTARERQRSLRKNFGALSPMDADVPLGGYTVVDRVLHDTNKIQDFSPYVARIKSSGADTVITGNWASDLVLLVKEIATSGLKVKLGAMFLDLPGSLESAG